MDILAEHDNFRQALDHAPTTGAQLGLACALRRYWYERGHYVEGRGWLERALAAAGDEPNHVRADAYTGIGTIASNQGDYVAARGALIAGIELYRGTDDYAGLADATNNLGALYYRQVDLSGAHRIWEETLVQRRRIGEPRGLYATLNNLGVVACDLNDFVAAELYHIENLTEAGDLAIEVANPLSSQP